MKGKKLSLFVLCSILAVSLFPLKVLAAPFYEGKVIKIIVGHGVGGGYDQTTRVLARFLPKHIPGKPSIFVENMPGGGTVIAANHLYKAAKADGSVIGLVDKGLPFMQLLKPDMLKVDLRRFGWLGSQFPDAFLLAIRADLPYRSYADLLKAEKPIHVGTVGPTTTDHQYPLMLKEYAGLKCNFVLYLSSAASSLALERKETDARAASFAVLRPYIERGLVRPLIRGRVSEPEIDNLPLDEDLATSRIGKEIFKTFSAVNQTGRCYFTPPGTPPEVLAILRKAMAETCEDPEFKGAFKKLGFTVRFTPAEEIEKSVNFILNQPEDIVKELNKIMQF